MTHKKGGTEQITMCGNHQFTKGDRNRRKKKQWRDKFRAKETQEIICSDPN